MVFLPGSTDAVVMLLAACGRCLRPNYGFMAAIIHIFSRIDV